MSNALQVNFRGVPPSETLVAMAAEQSRLIRRRQPELGECLVVIAAVHEARRSTTHAVVRFGELGSAHARQAEARHADPQVALRRALSEVSLPRFQSRAVAH